MSFTVIVSVISVYLYKFKHKLIIRNWDTHFLKLFISVLEVCVKSLFLVPVLLKVCSSVSSGGQAVAQRQSTCWACIRPWVWSLATQTNTLKHTCIHTQTHKQNNQGQSLYLIIFWKLASLFLLWKVLLLLLLWLLLIIIITIVICLWFTLKEWKLYK